MAAKPAEIAKPEPARTASLFNAPAPPAATPAAPIDTDEEDDILAEVEEEGQASDDEWDEAA
jgi:hypothetical protein